MWEDKLSVIIVNYQDYELTVKAVGSLISHGIKANIVVVDNDSPNDSCKYIKKEFSDINNITVLSSGKNGGYSYGNNYGIRYILKKIPDLEYICIMNPDVTITYADFFKNLLSKLEADQKLAGISALPITNGTVGYSLIGWKIPETLDLILMNFSLIKTYFNRVVYRKVPVDWRNLLGWVEVLPGSLFVIKADILQRAGLFDENVFLYEEENILAVKIKTMGYRYAVSLNDFYLHNHRKKDDSYNSLFYKWKDYRSLLRSRAYLARKYLKGGSIFWPFILATGYFHLIFVMPFIHIIKRLR